MLAGVIDSFKGEGKPGEQSTDISTVLEAYNKRRLGDALAVTKLSEEGMGGARSMRPAFMAQLALTVLLNKTLGRLFPKVCCMFFPSQTFCCSTAATCYP